MPEASRAYTVAFGEGMREGCNIREKCEHRTSCMYRTRRETTSLFSTQDGTSSWLGTLCSTHVLESERTLLIVPTHFSSARQLSSLSRPCLLRQPCYRMQLVRMGRV
jgi:hypothetical protein